MVGVGLDFLHTWCPELTSPHKTYIVHFMNTPAPHTRRVMANGCGITAKIHQRTAVGLAGIVACDRLSNRSARDSISVQLRTRPVRYGG